MAGVVWFVVLSYAWYVCFKDLGTVTTQDNLSRKAVYFHLIAWVSPFILAVSIISLSQVLLLSQKQQTNLTVDQPTDWLTNQSINWLRLIEPTDSDWKWRQKLKYLCTSLSKVDGNSLSGICFVGYRNMRMRIYFLLGPLGIDLAISGFFLGRGNNYNFYILVT